MQAESVLAALAPWRPAITAAAVAGLVLAMFAEHLQLLAKYRGARAGRVAGGYNDAMKVMVANRLGAVTYLLLVGLAIDGGIGAGALTAALAAGVLVVAALAGAVAWRLRGGGGDVGARGRVVLAVSALATVLNVLGLTIPMILSAHIPEMRLTLANTGFAFNLIFTILNVFVVETHAARLIDRDAPELRAYTAAIFASRAAATAAAGLGLALLAGGAA